MGEGSDWCLWWPISPFIESEEILMGVGSGSNGQMCKDKQTRTADPKTQTQFENTMGATSGS